MVQETVPNKYYKCPHCPCIFVNRVDLEKHVSCFGNHPVEHQALYARTHGRLEHGYSDE